MLGAPLKGDPQVVSGESGAVAMGLVATVMQDPDYQNYMRHCNWMRRQTF